MKIKYRIKKEDYIDFNMDQFKNSKDIKKFFLLQKSVVSSAFLVFILYLYKHADKPLYEFILFYGLVLIGWAVFEGFVMRFIVRKKLEKESEENVELFGEKTLKISKDALYDLSNQVPIKIDWSDVKFVDESKDYLFIFTISSLGYIIPKSFFVEQEEKNKFIESIKENIEQ